MRNRFTTVLIVVVVLGLGVGAAFAAGTVYGQKTAAKSVQPVVVNASGSSGGSAAAASGTADAAGGTSGRQGFGGGGFGGALTGTVSAVNGQQLTLTLANGQQLTVTLSGETHIGTVSQAGPSALTTGAQVLVSGTRGSDGTYTASAVIIVPAGFLPTPAAGSGAGGTGAGRSGQATPAAGGRSATPTP